MRITRLHQIAAHAGDLEETQRFYQETLGAKYIAAFDPPGILFFDFHGVRVMFEKQDASGLTVEKFSQEFDARAVRLDDDAAPLGRQIDNLSPFVVFIRYLADQLVPHQTFNHVMHRRCRHQLGIGKLRHRAWPTEVQYGQRRQSCAADALSLVDLADAANQVRHRRIQTSCVVVLA